ncbi:Receptor-like protein 52, partial [Camellia lanceoleosa]
FAPLAKTLVLKKHIAFAPYLLGHGPGTPRPRCVTGRRLSAPAGLHRIGSRFNSSRTVSIEELDYCEVFTNQLSGEIPTPIESLNLIKLNLLQNKLTGSIPQRLFQLKNLSFVWLFRNQLSGEIPIAIESQNLIGLDLSENNLTGSIPQ